MGIPDNCCHYMAIRGLEVIILFDPPSRYPKTMGKLDPR